MTNLLTFMLVFSLSLCSQMLLADDEEDMAEMQRQLNADVMAEPFDASDAAKVDAYIKKSMEADIKPRTAAPNYWQPGYSCRDIRRYSYRDYRDCRYHYRYYGRYW